MQDIINAVILGIVEGITEFLPVSSTGHLILVGDLLGFKGPVAESFEIFIQLGAILAVVFLYMQRFVDLLPIGRAKAGGGLRGYDGIMRIGIACVPAFVLGAILHKIIKERLFSPITVAIGFMVGGVLVLIVEWIWKRPVGETSDSALEQITLRQALMIGCCQCLALWPGMSRSASTIMGGMIAGLDRRTAAEFSFLVAVPVMVAATGLDLLKSASHIPTSAVPIFGVGFLVSFFVALAAIRWFISLLGRFTLKSFGWYRIVLGIITFILYQSSFGY